MSFLIEIVLGVLTFIIIWVCNIKILQACYEKDNKDNKDEKDKKNNKKVKKPTLKVGNQD